MEAAYVLWLSKSATLCYETVYFHKFLFV